MRSSGKRSLRLDLGRLGRPAPVAAVRPGRRSRCCPKTWPAGVSLPRIGMPGGVTAMSSKFARAAPLDFASHKNVRRLEKSGRLVLGSMTQRSTANHTRSCAGAALTACGRLRWVYDTFLFCRFLALSIAFLIMRLSQVVVSETKISPRKTSRTYTIDIKTYIFVKKEQNR